LPLSGSFFWSSTIPRTVSIGGKSIADILQDPLVELDCE